MEYLVNLWHQLTSKYSTDEKYTVKLWEEVRSRYSDKKRYYHNLDHLLYMIERLMPLKEKISDIDTLLYSVFYHDIIYHVSQNNNEEQSAAIAADRLKLINIPQEKISRCKKQIIATKTHDKASDNDTQYLIDADLAILGEEKSIYDKYRQNIRREYALYPHFLYKKGRRKVLLSFLEMDQIYKTKEFADQYELRARENISEELRSL